MVSTYVFEYNFIGRTIFIRNYFKFNSKTNFSKTIFSVYEVWSF